MLFNGNLRIEKLWWMGRMDRSTDVLTEVWKFTHLTGHWPFGASALREDLLLEAFAEGFFDGVLLTITFVHWSITNVF